MQAIGISTDAKSKQAVEITGIELGYYEASAMDEPAHLIPIYIFEGAVSDGLTKTSFVQYIPASPDFGEDIPEVK